MIALETARQLLNMGARMGQGPRAEEQLKGAVAICNMLHRNGVAYLADEVGMGKTYVALAALALLRHFSPSFRTLVIAPRENIQTKWQKDLYNFVKYNMRFPDLRVKALDGGPARPLVNCKSLVHLVKETTLCSDRDFFLRLPSFSLAFAGKEEVSRDDMEAERDKYRKALPWLKDEVFSLRNRAQFKDNIARAVCCALPEFDLVIVDEAHNLKHGYGEGASSRNRALKLIFGNSERMPQNLFPGYGPRAKRVLFLSATPLEENFVQLWNQLDLFGFGKKYETLTDGGRSDEEKSDIVREFLVRRVTSVRCGEEELTRNMYRREWRRGGVVSHDEPLKLEDPKQRLIVALVQKKVSELLNGRDFNASFQIGMLASFESFLETAKVKKADDEQSTFDDASETDDLLEKEGLDVKDVNRLAKSYRKTFGAEMPHPKMDALVEALAKNWESGEKALIFVRRIASVREIKEKLDDRYDEWLLSILRKELPQEVQPKLGRIIEDFREEKLSARSNRSLEDYDKGEKEDGGGKDTFFAWFFRGEGPKGVVSGANIQQRFTQTGTVYSTFFKDNYAAEILSCAPGEVEERLAAALGQSRETLREELRIRSRQFLPNRKKLARLERFEAVQFAAVQMLKESSGPFAERAGVIWYELFPNSRMFEPADDAPEIDSWLETKTFFTEIRRRPELRAKLWPEVSDGNPQSAFREQELRRELLGAAARLGHAFIDLYIMTIGRLKSLDLRAREIEEEVGSEEQRIVDYLSLLERQMNSDSATRRYGAFDELSLISEHFDLILDLNAHELKEQPAAMATRSFGTLLGRQKPIGGMSGHINNGMVKQFRMPGYPFILISTDLLQEGEDLHPFCSSVYHYGISWTPSSMEQRTGRIDRVRSQTERRLVKIAGVPAGEQKLQVYFPHLEDTVEVFQVRRVLERMNKFLTLVHTGLKCSEQKETRVKLADEVLRALRPVPQINSRLESAFPLQDSHLCGKALSLAADGKQINSLKKRFHSLRTRLPGLVVEWERAAENDVVLLGTAWSGSRRQPFSLHLRSLDEIPFVRCISPVGKIEPGARYQEIGETLLGTHTRVCALEAEERKSYDLTVEEDVPLAPGPASDITRISFLIRRTIEQADKLERIHLKVDQALEEFRDDLVKETVDAV